jgi:hypothetical protein
MTARADDRARQSRSVKVGVSLLLASGKQVDGSSFTRARRARRLTTVRERAYRLRVTLSGKVNKKTRTTVTLSMSTA